MKQQSDWKRLLRYLLSILIPVALLTGIFFRLISGNIVRLTTANISQQASDNADKINAYMAEVVGDMEDIRELAERNCSTDEELVEFIRSTENYGVFGGAYVGDDHGFYVGSTPWDIPDDYVPSSRPWFIDGKDSRTFVFGEPYLDASVGQVCVSISARMDAGDDSIVRVIAADIYLDYTDSLMEEMVENSSLNGAILVTGDTGILVADSLGEYTGQNITESSAFYKLLHEETVNKDSGQYTVSLDKETYYVSIEEVPVTGWYLILFENKKIVLHDLYIAEAVMAIVTAAVVAFLTWVMVRYGKEVSEVEQQANRAKTEFISRISHDIRTPIGQVLNLTEFAKADKNNPEKLDEDLDRIDSSGRFLLSLINDVLDVSQIESNRMELHPTALPYKDYITDIRNIFLPLCENKGLTCSMDNIDRDLPDLYCDEVRLKQITLNLLSNAVKYTPAGGSVSYISQSQVKDDGSLSFRYTIRDTGVGMTKELMDHMFEKFTRDTKNELRDNTQVGSGLGLYLVKSMVELMGGTIAYESELGKGTSVTVQIDLPKAPEQAKKSEEEITHKAAETSLSYKGHVLLAEDNDLNAEIAMRLLEELGLTVTLVNNGKEALDAFTASTQGTFKLIFMDIQMPVMNGYEASRAVRASSHPDAQTVPIVAMTADAFKDAMDEAKASGMNDFITKPLILTEICSILEKYGLTDETVL